MSSPIFLGNAAPIRQVNTITVALTWAAGDSCTISCDNVDFVVTIGTLVTTAQVATTIKQAFNSETLTDTTASFNVYGGAIALGAFAEVAATIGSTTSIVNLTANTPGKPFTFTVTEATVGNGTATGATLTASAGPAEGDNVDNYDTNAVPVDNDLIYFQGSNNLLYDLNLAQQPLQINKPKSYTGLVGLPIFNRDNASKTYREYRTPRYLTTDDNSAITTSNLETGTGPGSGRFMLDNGAGQAIVNIFGKGPRTEAGVPAILWKGSHASNVVNNLAGDLGVAWFSSETAVIATLRSGDGPQSPAETYCTPGVTLTTVIMNGGKLYTSSAITTATQNAGEYQHNTGTITTLNVNGGTFYPLGGATLTTLKIGSGGTFDARRGDASFAITNTVDLYAGSKFYDPNGRTGNPVFRLNGCKLSDVTIDLPIGKVLTPS